MKFQLPERAFPALVLSAHEERDLIDEADRIIEETIAAQERYIARGRRIDVAQWKHFRTKEGINVYRQRGLGGNKKLFDPLAATDDDARSDVTATTPSWLPVRDGGVAADGMARTPGMFSFRAAKTPGARRAPQSTKSMASLDEHPATLASPSASSVDNLSTSSEHGWMEYQRKPAHVPGMLAVGVVDGRLEDAMYGVFSEDDASWRWKSSQINDKLDDARVLATIRGPTRDDPFRFIGVKWFTKEHPSALHSVVKRRDFLTIEAMGTTYDASGQIRLGYFMMHSIEIPRIPVLSDLDILRGQASFCFILRQASPSSIEIFSRGFSDPQGEMYEAVSVLLASESILAAVRIVDFGHIKKLRWLMMNRRQQQHRHRHRHGALELDPTVCATCRKPVKRLSSLFQGSAACQVCHASVCSKCVITKQITIDISADGATQKPLPFCLACVMEAKGLAAWDLQLESVTQRQYNLLPADLFPSGDMTSFRSQHGDAVRREDPAALRRAASAPRMNKPRSGSNSRMRSSSHGRELYPQPPHRQPPPPPPQTHRQPPPPAPQDAEARMQQRRREQGSVLLYT